MAVKKIRNRLRDSVEKIWHDLGVISDIGCQDEKLLVVKTLLKLPKKIREKVLDEVTFIFLSADYEGTIVKAFLSDVILKKDIKDIDSKKCVVAIKPFFILLNFALIKRRKEIDAMSTIAHEIAHFILGHNDNKNNISHSEGEKEADALIEKWGFKKCYTTTQIKRFQQYEKIK